VKAVIDSSTLISLAWSGLLSLLQRCPLDLVVPTEVHRETVVEGVARGHPDAAAIEAAVASLESSKAGEGGSVDDAVLRLGCTVGVLLTNDVALGRRAANLGVGWLRTADLVVLCVRSGRIDPGRGQAALQALYSAGRITADLLEAYRKELE
jgi:rRNA-processing protein FCF1